MGSAGFYVDLRATVRSNEFVVSVEADRPLSLGPRQVKGIPELVNSGGMS